jgi:uncharacterized protein (TIGR03067 family)
MLAKRLAQRGVVLSGGALATVLSQKVASASVPTSVVSSTITAVSLLAAGQAVATGAVSVKVAALTEGVLKTMFLTKVKVVMVLLLVASLSGAAGLIYRTQAAEQPPARRATEKADKGKQPIATKKAEKPKPDKERLQGTWKIVSSVDDGERHESEVGGEWTFKDTTIKAMSPAKKNTGAFTSYLRFRLDEATNPKVIDLVEGKADDLFDTAKFDKRLDDADERKEGIYSLDGDTLKICISRTKGERPTAFESKEGSTYILWTLRRERPKDEEEKGGKRTAAIDGVVDGKKFQPAPKLVESGTEAAVKLLAASNLTDFYGAPQNRPFDKADWQREVVAGIEKMRPHLRIQFGKPRQIEGRLNGEKAKYSVSEVVFFEPGGDGPVCLWGRDGDKYYFANQIAGHEELVRWLGKAQGR